MRATRTLKHGFAVMKNKVETERCGICGCLLYRGKGSYASPSLAGRSHATKHHFVAERFFGRSANRRGTLRDTIFDKCPWGLEGKTALFCYECHELLVHNPVLLPGQVDMFSKLVRQRRLSERVKSASHPKIAARIKLFQEVIAAGFHAVSAMSANKPLRPAVRKTRSAQTALEKIDMMHPHDFDGIRLQALMQRVHPFQDKPAALREVLSALKGVEYRFSACAAHEEAFTRLISDDANAAQTRDLQERELFGFFVTGQSAIECVAFAAYLYASCISPTRFSAKLHTLKLRNIADTFRSNYPNDCLTAALAATEASSDWQFWTRARNRLTHQSHPGRNLSNVGPTMWLGVEFGTSFTSDRRKWLAKIVDELLLGLEAFVHAYPVQ